MKAYDGLGPDGAAQLVALDDHRPLPRGVDVEPDDVRPVVVADGIHHPAALDRRHSRCRHRSPQRRVTKRRMLATESSKALVTALRSASARVWSRTVTFAVLAVLRATLSEP